ncbi:MAG: hypothetical protein OXG53_07140 [Chloroflexi bacterium]|nr:hypothetical protein [Chloroflexota bacterium]
MIVKRFTLVLALLALFTAAVSANDAPARKGYAVFGRWLSGLEALLYEPIVQEATGLEPEALRDALLEGSTLSELIEANEGDVDAVIADLVAQASDEINARAATSIESLEESFTEALNESQRRRFPWWRRRNPVRELFGVWNMDETLTVATGLDKPELNSALLEGSTLAELIEANEGDVASVVSTLVAQATDGINAAAADRNQRYEAMIADAFDADFSDSSRRWRKWRPRHGAFFSFWGSYDSSQTTTENGNVEALGESEEA